MQSELSKNLMRRRFGFKPYLLQKRKIREPGVCEGDAGMGKNRVRNLYKADGKFYVRSIQSCICKEMYDDRYMLDCRIKEGGTHQYFCCDDPEYIVRYLSKKSLWLSDEAKAAVNDAIDRFNKGVREALGDGFTKVEISECLTTLYYRHIGKDRFDFLIFYKSVECIPANAKRTVLLNNSTLQEMFHDMRWYSLTGDETINLFRESTNQIIEENPIYAAAAADGDISMQNLLKLHYRIASEEECIQLSENVFDAYILPPLPEKYNRNYPVYSETIKRDLLKRSGYKIWHTPNVSMYGQTRRIWMLNPHSKTGIDSGPSDSEAMTYDEFMELFNKKRYTREEYESDKTNF